MKPSGAPASAKDSRFSFSVSSASTAAFRCCLDLERLTSRSMMAMIAAKPRMAASETPKTWSALAFELFLASSREGNVEEGSVDDVDVGDVDIGVIEGDADWDPNTT